MSHRSALSRGLCVVASLLLVTPVVSAAPRAKKAAPKRGKKPAPKAEEPAEPPAAPPEPEPEPEPAAQVAPEPTPAVVEASPAPKVEPSAPVAIAAEASVDDADAALGRRERERASAGRILVAVSAGVDVGRRQFEYNDAVGDGYAPYRLPGAPLVSFGLEAYPWASSGVPVLRDLGFRGRVSRGFAFDSSTPQGVQLETTWTRFGGDLRERLLFPSLPGFELGVLAGVDANYFGMRAKGDVPALLPAARTVSLRFGLDARTHVAWRLSVLASVGYLLTTSKGEIYEHFRDGSVAGVDAEAGFAVALVHGVELRLGARYTRYFAKFEPRLGDRAVAGGALDQLWQFGLGARYAY